MSRANISIEHRRVSNLAKITFARYQAMARVTESRTSRFKAEATYDWTSAPSELGLSVIAEDTDRPEMVRFSEPST